MKNTQKIKYAIQAVIVASIFVFISTPARASEITPNNVITYVNLARESQGLPALVINTKLMQVAKDKLDDMIANQYFAHISPTGVSPWVWFQKENYDYHYAGENLAINFTSAESEQMAWMKSPTHRKNILDANYQEIGVAVGTSLIDGHKSIVAVQEFGATFAGVPTGEKNFTPFQNSKLKTDDGTIVPQVLSAKSATPSQPTTIGTGSGGQAGIWNWLQDNRVQIIEQGFLVALIVMMLSIILAAAAFMAVAADKILLITRDEKVKEKGI